MDFLCLHACDRREQINIGVERVGLSSGEASI
jgi:hypothetical protein